MTRQEQLDLIRAACIEANPSDTTLRDQHSWQGLQIRRRHGRPIRLADVLEAARTVGYDSTEDRLGVITGVVTRYDLRKDDLPEQSDECVAHLSRTCSDEASERSEPASSAVPTAAAEEKHEHDDDDERCTVHEETPIGSCGQ
jgi:hypothetical protein